MTTELRAILTVLYRVAEVDSRYLQKEWKFTPGNLSRHLRKLEATGYVTVKRAFRGRFPRTVYSLSAVGREVLARYARMLKAVSGN
jgi:DNA-binding PadR family transcriptional regulator